MQTQSLKEVQIKFNDFAGEVESLYESLKIDKDVAKLSELRKKLEDPDVWQDNSRREEMRIAQTSIAALERKIEGWQKIKKEISNLLEYIEIALLEKEEKMADEFSKKLEKLQKEFTSLELQSLLSGTEDTCNAFLNIHPGAGGTESQDWADMLYRAYLRWAERSGFAVDIIDYQEGEEAGIKNVTILVKGLYAYGYLKAENGIHRLVRISPFDSNKRRHTSFSAVHVSPEISEDIEIDIQEKDLRIDTYRASGAGGQHVNKTDSAVRITHAPTGIVVACQNERSQTKNKATAMKLLKARLYERAEEEKQKEIESKSGERKDISWGNQIRSYVFHPYNMVKDLRTGHETGNIQAVMDGDFDAFIDAFLRFSASSKNS
ncbi:MAG: peptide chain release factor 2 [Spirochaetia bacterium]|nr:peptide chain release factor 2 [Spirochaetia bacterium]